MTQAPAPDQPAAAAPLLLHAGTYAVYRTPSGGMHVTYRRETALNEETGQLEAVDETDEHLPEMPAPVVGMLRKMARTGERPNPMTMLKMMMDGGNGDGPDQLG